MNVAIIKHSITISPTGGVKVQAEMWKKGLEDMGHQVELINIWNTNNWEEFDIILILEYSGNMIGYVHFLHSINPNIVVAPIIDTLVPAWKVSFASISKITKLLGLFINVRFSLIDIYNVKDKVKLFLVRSNYEKKYLKAIGVPDSKIAYVPLHYRVSPPSEMPQKEDFVFNVCLLADKRKNIERLIQASKIKKFKLVLAGSLRNDDEQKWLYNQISGCDNISYLGRLSDADLFDNYKRAKVFALPSINEGVGMVALEASTYGCEIVITNLGAPKEYYKGKAHLVDPYSVNSIGNKIMEALLGEVQYQPQLKEHIIENYNSKYCMSLLVNAFNTVINNE